MSAIDEFIAVTEFPEFTPSWSGKAGNGGDYMTGWDLCVLGGDKLPGLAEVGGKGIELRRDPNKAPGKHGGRPVYSGLAEQEVQIKIIVWTQRQLGILWGLRAKLLPIPGAKPKIVTIESPWLKLVGISTVEIHGASPLKLHSSARVGHGLEMTITASHWLGGEKDANKNVQSQPKKTDPPNARPYTPGAPAPVSVAGSCGPPAFQPGA